MRSSTTSRTITSPASNPVPICTELRSAYDRYAQATRTYQGGHHYHGQAQHDALGDSGQNQGRGMRELHFPQQLEVGRSEEPVPPLSALPERLRFPLRSSGSVPAARISP